MSIYYEVVIARYAEEVFDYTIDGGEELLMFGVDDFSEIVSWINLADLTLELVPDCRESLHACLDWFGTNRERVEVSLTILRDARQKLRNPLYVSWLSPSPAYRMMIERVSGRTATVNIPYHLPSPRSLSGRDLSPEEEQ